MVRWGCEVVMAGARHRDWVVFANIHTGATWAFKVALPGLIPLLALVAFGCTRAGIRIHRGEGRRPWQALLMISLGWYPVLIWLIAQFIPNSPR